MQQVPHCWSYKWRAGAVAIGAGAVVPVLGLVGFSATGPVAGTVAAAWQASIGSVVASSLFSTVQSVAMGGAATALSNTAIGGGLMSLSATTGRYIRWKRRPATDQAGVEAEKGDKNDGENGKDKDPQALQEEDGAGRLSGR